MYNYEEFEVLNNWDKADEILNQLAYWYYSNISRMSVKELIGISDKILNVVDRLHWRED